MCQCLVGASHCRINPPVGSRIQAGFCNTPMGRFKFVGMSLIPLTGGIQIPGETSLCLDPLVITSSLVWRRKDDLRSFTRVDIKQRTRSSTNELLWLPVECSEFDLLVD